MIEQIFPLFYEGSRRFSVCPYRLVGHVRHVCQIAILQPMVYRLSSLKCVKEVFKSVVHGHNRLIHVKKRHEMSVFSARIHCGS